jgi:hypothetical protein
VLPTLNLDFANSQSLDKRITFSRGSIGTRVNRNGLIETIPANQPRFDFDPISGECRGLLIEESRSNLFTYSDDAETAWGIKSGLTVSANTDIAPDGNQTMDTLVEDAARNDKYLERQITVNANQNITWSCYVKPLRRTNIFLVIYDGASYSNNVNFRYEFSNQTVTLSAAFGTGTFGSYSVVYVGNGVYRMVLSGQPTTSASTSVRIRIGFVNQSTTYTGTGVSAAAVWGAQLETGAFPTSYIPTTASTVTRSADNASMTGTNFSSWYNQTESTIFCKFNAYNNIGVGQKNIIDIRGSAALGLNLVQLQLNYISATSQHIYHNLYQNGRNFADYFALSYTTGPTKNIMRYKDLDNFVASKDGNIRSNTSRTKTIPLSKNMDSLFLGTFNGAISKFAYYPKALNDAEIQYLTQ